jgi:hypothetical protein
MKRKLAFLIFVLGWIAPAQQQSLITWPVLSSAAVTTAYNTPGNDKHTLAVVVAGTPAACTVALEGSMDTVTWASLSGNQTCTSTVMFHVTDRPVVFVRANLSALSGGTKPTVTITYLGIKSGGK